MSIQGSEEYRQSWNRLTESQQRLVCHRFGIVFTHSHDNDLITQIVIKQQLEYEAQSLKKEHLKPSRIEDLSTVLRRETRSRKKVLEI